MEFRLPALGEGIESATVTAVLVKPGDAVKAGQNVIAVETDKAAVEVPVDAAGMVAQVHVKPGDKIPAGGLARELAVGLAEVKGSGRGGRVTLDDVKGFVRSERQRVREGGGAAAAPGGSIVNAFTLPPLPDFSKFGPVEVHDFAPIRQTIA